MIRLSSRMGLLAVAMSLGGCVVTHPETDSVLTAPGALPPKSAVAGIRFQAYVDLEGAPGALAMALDWSGASTRVASLVPELGNAGNKQVILDMVNRHGRVAYPVGTLRALLHEVAAGHPVLTLQEPSGKAEPVWRYALITGYDLQRGLLNVHSGVIENLKLPIAVFERNWQRADNWAVVVLPPERRPASAKEKDYPSAAAAPAEAQMAAATK